MSKTYRNALLACLLLAAMPAAALPGQYAFRVAFHNKNGTADLSAPLSFLSQRSLDRRAAQGVAIDSTDLPVSPAYINEVLSVTGGVLHATSRWFNQCVVLVEDSADILPISSNPDIASVMLVGYFPGGLHMKAGGHGKYPEACELDPLANHAKITGDPFYYGQSWTATNLVHGDALHDAGYRGQGRLIAVLDAGFANYELHTGFDSLRNSGRIKDTWNFVGKTSDVSQYSQHGMIVLSHMAGYIPGTFVGSAPLADYALYITEEANYESLLEFDNLIAGAERADSLGADVINCSLGYNNIDNPATQNYTPSTFDGHTTIAAQAVNIAAGKGIFWCNSAGNEGGNSWNFLLTPGDADSALTVGGVDADKNYWPGSSPGVADGNRVKPDVALLSTGINGFTGTDIAANTGTSFASPQAAGYAACLLQAHPGIRPYAIRKAIHESADHYNAPTPQLGYGVPDFSQVLLALSVDTEDAALTDEVLVWPVPFSSDVYLRWPSYWNGHADIMLSDAVGSVVWRGGADALATGVTHIWLPGGLTAGVYFLSGAQYGKKFLKKIVRR